MRSWLDQLSQMRWMISLWILKVSVTGTMHACSYVNNKNDNAILIAPITDSEIISAFMPLNNSSSCDADGIQVRPIKFLLDMISPYLTDVCLTADVFPIRMQLAKVTVLYKKGDKTV